MNSIKIDLKTVNFNSFGTHFLVKGYDDIRNVLKYVHIKNPFRTTYIFTSNNTDNNDVKVKWRRW